VRVRGVVGNGVGRMLREHAARRGLQLGRVVVLNDTIATLVGGSLAPGVVPERSVGLIVGTGTNIGAWLPSADIIKLPSDDLAGHDGRMAVNFESGAFASPSLGAVDEIVDESSQNPGAQRFEKAISGAYMGRLFQAACRLLDCGADASADSKDEPTAAEVSALAQAPAQEPRNVLARVLLNRSAEMVAASLAATYDLVHGEGASSASEGPDRDLFVCAEGSLFWKAPGYVAQVQETLDGLLAPSGARAHITHVNNANLLGSTAAVLGKG
jgi:hexokinase